MKEGYETLHKEELKAMRMNKRDAFVARVGEQERTRLAEAAKQEAEAKKNSAATQSPPEGAEDMALEPWTKPDGQIIYLPREATTYLDSMISATAKELKEIRKTAIECMEVKEMLHRQMNEVASSTRINSNPAPGKTGILSSTGNCNANNRRVHLNDTYDIHEYFQPSMESTVRSADTSKVGIRQDQEDLPHNPMHVERQDRPIENAADGRRPSNTYTSADLGKTVRSWNVKFNGSSGMDVEEFLRRIKECMDSARLSEAEVLGSMSELLTGTALRWYRNYKNSWQDWPAFCASARRFFGVTQYFQERLQTEVSTRTQGSAEPVAEYIICAHGLMNQIEGKWTPEQQLEQLYQNMRPELKKLVPRERVTSVDRLVELARTQERILKDEQSYKEPPPPEEVFWSEFACKVRKKEDSAPSKKIAVAAMVQKQPTPEINDRSLDILEKITQRLEALEAKGSNTSKEESARDTQREPSTEARNPNRGNKNYAKPKSLHLGHLPSVLGKREGEQVGEVAIAPLAETSNQKAEPTKFIVGQEDSLSECSSFQGENLDHRAPLPPHPRWWTVAEVGEFKIRALIDSGASRTCFGPVGLQVATHMGIEVVPCSGTSISGADGQLIRLTAQAKIRIKVANKTRELVVFMANSLDYDCVLGADWHVLFYAMVDPRTHELYFNKVKVCNVEFDCNNSTSTAGLTAIGLEGPTPDEEKELEEILARCLPVNDESSLIGCTDLIEHEIEVTCQRPIKQRCYPVSKKLEDIMYEQLDNMIRQGIVKPSKSSWASPVVMVKKANGKYRFCVDYRKLNAVTKVSARPIPNMDSILRKLRTARYITTLDLSQAYHQVRIKEEHRHLTAFAVPGRGLYEWVRMAFGLAGAPATFQSLMDSIIGPDLEPYAFAYLDDIIVATSTFEQHKEVLADVLTRLTKAGLTINREKSHFCCQEVKYLGVLVDRDGYRPDPEKIEPIINFPTPKTLKQLRTFLGAASWYRKFIDNFATIAEPLTGLTRKETKFTWAEEQIEAFEKLKTMIASAPMLARPVPGDDVFTIHTDASDTGIGAVLTQVLEGEERVLEFASRTMSPAERNYSVTERECLAVLWAVRKFRPYIEGYRFKVLTDHQSLKWLQKLQNPSGRLARWSLELQDHDIQVEYRPGALNHVPDALSRMHEEPAVEIAAFEGKSESEDKWYNKMYEAVEKEPESYPNWKIVGRKLYKYNADKALEPLIDEEETWKLVLPREKRAEALFEAHEELTAGHLGRRKTYLRVAALYYWPSMQKDVENYVKECFICQQCKVEQLVPGGLMGQRRITRPWEMVAADITGPFPRSRKGNKYLLIFMDMFTRYIECIAIKKANGPTITQKLYGRIFMRFGAPEILLTDNGTEFKNEVMTQFLEKNGVKQLFVPAYHPQSNSVERVNRTVKTMIVSYLEDKHSNWDENVAEITFAYNTAVQDSTGASPAFLNFGRQPRIANSLRFREEQEGAENIDEEAQAKWKDHLAKVHEFYNTINERIKRAQEKQAKYYNKKHREVDLQVGELVLRRNRILSSAANQIAAKLAPKFYGPLIITAKVGTNIYELADRQGVPVGPTHVKDLKRFHGSSDEFEQDDDEIESDDEDEQAEIQESPEEMHQDARPQEQEEEQIARPQESQIEKGPRPRKTRALVVRQKETNKMTGRKPITNAGEGTKMSSEQSETAEDSDGEPGKHQDDEASSRRITRAAARKKATAKGCAVASEGDTVAQQ
uniref:RNA-directed DNA polymerase n=1 Tax=Trichogramma kaykai TaxID=54128 RepID=A0ABD2WPB5_9HYME